MEQYKGKEKIIIIFGILFIAVSILLLVVFFAGKKTYVVRFELNGGTLVSGSLEQHITQGQDAHAPTAVKDGAYLRSWSASTKRITKDMVIEAVWEYETTAGIVYSDSSNQNFTEIAGAYKYIRGEVYLGAYHDDKKVLGIQDGAFSGCADVTRVYLLEGLIHIGKDAFSGCSSLLTIEIPETVSYIGDGAFSDCESLQTIVINEGVREIGAQAFKNCTSLREIVLPASLEKIGKDAFLGCDELVITITHEDGKSYDGYAEGFEGSAEVEWPEGVNVGKLNIDDLKIPFDKIIFDRDKFKETNLDRIKSIDIGTLLPIGTVGE